MIRKFFYKLEYTVLPSENTFSNMLRNNHIFRLLQTFKKQYI